MQEFEDHEDQLKKVYDEIDSTNIKINDNNEDLSKKIKQMTTVGKKMIEVNNA